MRDKAHGNKGNKNALKPEDDKADSYIHLRCTKEQKIKYIQTSKSKGLKLTKWILDILDSFAFPDKK